MRQLMAIATLGALALGGLGCGEEAKKPAATGPANPSATTTAAPGKSAATHVPAKGFSGKTKYDPMKPPPGE